MEKIVSRYPSPVTRNPYQLNVNDLDAHLDVLSFDGEEYLSQPFCYTIRFTCAERRYVPGTVYRGRDPQAPRALDLDKDHLLKRFARFALYGEARQKYPWEEKPPKHEPLRELFGFITSFQRTGGSVEEGHYQITLEPRLALLGQGKQYRLYRNLSVPEIVKQILLERHRWFPHQIDFLLHREYPRREQVMQFGESDLAFIQRLLAEVGIWYRIGFDSRHLTDVVHCADLPCREGFEIQLPLLPGKGMGSPGQDSLWNLATHHQVVEKDVYFRSYDPRQAAHGLYDQTEIPGTTETTHGERYEYTMPYTELGVKGSQLPGPATETGHFYARLTHQRNQNLRTQLTGVSSSPILMPAHLLVPEGDIPQDFAKKVLIHSVATKGGRRVGFTATFKGIPYDQFVGFRPALQPKPVIAGTIPARISSSKEYDRYGHLNQEGRYRVHFHFDRDERERGLESAWLRLARPYAGEKYGLHLPLIAGTEVAIAFEQGDPDRPYIAHALHDSRHPDHVTDDNHQRNVLRTPANNKLRMGDREGEEHVKLSTEFAGKSQLNLGHLVDNKRQKRGEGYELRTDHWGALRAGKGVFISADAQHKAQGPVLEMGPALDRLQQAGEQLQALSADAQACRADPADVQAQLALMKNDLEQLKSAVLLLSAPKGIALASGNHLQLAAEKNLMLNAGGHADMSVIKRLFIGVGEGLSLFVRKLGIKLIANQGPVEIQAQHDTLTLMARQGLEITSTEDEIRIVAKKKITLNAGGSYLVLDPTRIEAGTEGDYNVKAPRVAFTGAASMSAAHPEYPLAQFRQPVRFNITRTATAPRVGWAGMPYRLYAGDGLVSEGVLDRSGQVRIEHQPVTHSYRLQLANGLEFRLPVPDQYSNPEQAHMANRGLQNHQSLTNEIVNQPRTHKEHRTHYSALLDGSVAPKEENP